MGVRVSARPDPRAVHRTIGRGVLAARSAGPVEALGHLVISGSRERGAAHRRYAERTTNRVPDGSVDRGSIGSASGFFLVRAPVCDRPASAFVFPAASTSCLGLFPLSGLTDAAAAAAGTSGRRRMVRRVPPCRPAAALPRPNPLMGLASDVSRPGDGPGKQYQRSSSSPMCGVVASTVRSREMRRRHAQSADVPSAY